MAIEYSYFVYICLSFCFFIILTYSCIHDGGDIECNKDIESEAKKPTSCGMITDPDG